MAWATLNPLLSCRPLPADPNQYSWGENYAGSSGLMSSSPELCPTQRARSSTVSGDLAAQMCPRC